MTDAPRKRPPRARGNPPESPWANGGAEASRNTVRRMIRLRPEEDTALARVAARRGLDLARAIGELKHDMGADRALEKTDTFARCMAPAHLYPERGDWYAAHLSACGYMKDDGTPITGADLRAFEAA